MATFQNFDNAASFLDSTLSYYKKLCKTNPSRISFDLFGFLNSIKNDISGLSSDEIDEYLCEIFTDDNEDYYYQMIDNPNKLDEKLTLEERLIYSEIRNRELIFTSTMIDLLRRKL